MFNGYQKIIVRFLLNAIIVFSTFSHLSGATSEIKSVAEIIVQPRSQTIEIGRSKTLRVIVYSDYRRLQYQWYYNGGRIDGANKSGYRISKFQPEDAGEYHVTITNKIGTVSSEIAKIEVDGESLLRAIPAIRTQPKPDILDVGTKAKLFVKAKGFKPLTYQWYLDNQLIIGADKNTYTIEESTLENAGSYHVVVSNKYGVAVSDTAQLTINGIAVRALATQAEELLISSADAASTIAVEDESIAITQQPVSITTVVGRRSGFRVKVEGEDLAYQWWHNGVPIKDEYAGTEGANTTQLKIRNTQSSHEGTYVFTAENDTDIVFSNVVKLDIVSEIHIRKQPKDLTAIVGTSAKFKISVIREKAIKKEDVSYQWFFNNNPIFGENNDTLNIDVVLPENAGGYYCKVTTLNGIEKLSDVAILTINDILIGRKPSNKAVKVGSKVEFISSLKLKGNSKRNFINNNFVKLQWFKDDRPITGATELGLIIKDVQVSDTGNYSLALILNGSKLWSNSDYLLVYHEPEILGQPVSQTSIEGNDILLNVEAIGSPLPSYQWTRNGENIPGENGSTLSLINIDSTDGGNYSVIVYNDFGIVKSNDVTVFVDSEMIGLADDIEDRVVINLNSGIGIGSNIEADKQSGEPKITHKESKKSVWISWTPSSNGLASFSTLGSNFDTIMAVYILKSDELFKGLTKIEYDDDGAGYHNSLAQFSALSGVEYFIAIDGVDKATGNIVLSWDLIPTNEVVPEILLNPKRTTLNKGSTLALYVDYNSVYPIDFQWYIYDQPIQGATHSNLVLHNFGESDVGLYSVALISDEIKIFSKSAEIQINTEGIPFVAARNKLSDAVDSALISGKTLAGRSTNSKSINAKSLSNTKKGRSFAPITGYTGTQIFATAPGKDPNEPNHCGIVGGASYWFVYNPPQDGVLTLDTNGSDFDTILGVYTDSNGGEVISFAELVGVACDNNSGIDGVDSSLTTNVVSTETYYIVIDGVLGAFGHISLNYSLNVLPTISALSDQVTELNQTIGPISFSINDYETNPDNLVITCLSSNINLVDQNDILMGGGGEIRTLTITPKSNQFGNSVITVLVTDENNVSSSRSFSLTVNEGTNNAPVTAPDWGYRAENSPHLFYIPDLLANDSDPDGDNISLVSIDSVSIFGGTLLQFGDYLIYYPVIGFNDFDVFTYTITDDKGVTSIGYVYSFVAIWY